MTNHTSSMTHVKWLSSFCWERITMRHDAYCKASHKYRHHLAIIDSNSSKTKLMTGGKHIMSSFTSVVIIIISFTQIAEISVFKILAELCFPSHNCVCGAITGE